MISKQGLKMSADRRPYIDTPTSVLIRWSRLYTTLTKTTKKRFRDHELVDAELLRRVFDRRFDRA